MVSWQYGIDTHYVYMTEPGYNGHNVYICKF